MKYEVGDAVTTKDNRQFTYIAAIPNKRAGEYRRLSRHVGIIIDANPEDRMKII